ncbi:methylamine utilization protein [Rheinheimera maricola]|uniref:Methylamine utilization protein n=1 Tax=Rheinheimera maricola TaxID=2793282 RepID=A0ABS7X756_9GAMM|nr:methylamine utilization protein [Rheinheimera maricola]MBZ9611378.1 methylamine utilization protein [Rheinheimera maricola]
MRIAFFFIMLLSVAWSGAAYSAELTIQVRDQQQQALAFTVVELIHPDYPAIQADSAQIVQRDLMFSPFVSVVQRGALVEFPNQDKTRHHVYSFSPAKQFELRLYLGKPEAAIEFDQPGLVTLGCNIHDNMLAYLYVAQSRFVGITDQQGVVKFTDLPALTYQLHYWQPWLTQPVLPQQLIVSADNQQLSLNLEVQRQSLPEPAGTALQQHY